MSEPGKPAVPAGWYPDPQSPAATRYWNGTEWTQHQRPAVPAAGVAPVLGTAPTPGAPPVAGASGYPPVTRPAGAPGAPASGYTPAPPMAPAYAAPPMAPAGTDGNTVWIWLVVLMPLVPLLLLLAVPWGSMFHFDADDPQAVMDASTAIFRAPAYWLAMVTSWAVYGLGVLFAYFDYQELTKRGVPKPFHWAWSFLTSVYPIGRSVVVKRRTGTGSAPMWAAIGVIALSLVISFVITGIVMASVLDMVSGGTDIVY